MDHLTDEERMQSYREFVRRKSEHQRQYRQKQKLEAAFQKQAGGITKQKRKYERRVPRATTKLPSIETVQPKEEQGTVSTESDEAYDYEFVSEELIVVEPEDGMHEESPQMALLEVEDSGDQEEEAEPNDSNYVDVGYEQAPRESFPCDEAGLEQHTEAMYEDEQEAFYQKRDSILRLMDQLVKGERLIYLAEVEAILRLGVQPKHKPCSQ